ncbi:hypothetical protein GQF61_07725 [Sphingobacterium sp. DK4209]|uniref:Phosphoenolpyruvate carboxykinase n=1 Tax=Sphingobacterium zhuxiongii TaxID=2662364 RepID=A0A5Q0QEG6_9SPHI|nr:MULTISPECIES: hypothetical protein [unclassified Sphingobacterium]MVZ65744.1 hypothetical protein [Sphingobacterium sp. DK4209]QGA27943.1 hypothetical protein GFH32_17120 [Sphingobacterium sp. dk4302]
MEIHATFYYRVADHVIKIVDYLGLEIDRALPSFLPFRCAAPKIDPMMTIAIKRNTNISNLPPRKILSDISVIWLERFRFEESSDNYFTSILGTRQKSDWLMCSEKDFSRSVIYPEAEELFNTNKLSWLIMVAFGQACLAYRTLLIHASVVENGHAAVAFLGKSGTGKSTHSRLWMKYLPEFGLLNDDNPAIRICGDNQVLIFGTPWSGKTHCYRRSEFPLNALVRLEQSSYNDLSQQKEIQALTAVLPSCSAIRWNANLFNQMVSSLELIISQVKVAKLKCLPDKGAVELSHSFALDDPLLVR